jgi:hypothetical protein
MSPNINFNALNGTLAEHPQILAIAWIEVQPAYGDGISRSARCFPAPPLPPSTMMLGRHHHRTNGRISATAIRAAAAGTPSAPGRARAGPLGGGRSPAAQALTALQETTRLRNTANRGIEAVRNNVWTPRRLCDCGGKQTSSRRVEPAHVDRLLPRSPARDRRPSACRARLPGWSRRPWRGSR